MHGEGDGVQQGVDGLHHVLPVLPGRAVLDGQAAGYEVILDINDHKGGLWLDDLQT